MLEKAIITAIVHFAFVWVRTYNILSISKKDVKHTLISGVLVYITWIVGISIDIDAFQKVVDGEYSYLLVLCFSLIGGLSGSYLAVKS